MKKDILASLSRAELEAFLEDAARNWLAHDGLWFQAVERAHGIEEAIRLDALAWEQFTEIEARRIMTRHGIGPGGGIPALVRALDLRLYALMNEQEVVEQTHDRCVFRMVGCRVQDTRGRKGLPDFPCKSVGLVEYSRFASTVDPRILTRCLRCPPDARAVGDPWCEWEFTLG